MTGPTRRDFLRQGSTMGVAGVAVAGVPMWRERRPTYVLVHGSASNAFFWSPIARELALLGHRSLAVDLPGHGLDAEFPLVYQAPQDTDAYFAGPSKLAGKTLDDYAGHVIDVVHRVASHGPVILVGHSLGGATLNRVGNAVPDLIHRLVYVSAFCCVRLPSALDYIIAPENSGAQPVPAFPGDPAKTGFSRYNWRTADRTFLDAYKTAVMADASQDEFLALLNYVQQPDESVAASTDDARVDAGTWGRIPRTYVRLTRDRLNTPRLQSRMIAEADELTPHNRFEVREVAAGHVDVVLKATQLAAILGECA